jgi:hypothetical protein
VNEVKRKLCEPKRKRMEKVDDCNRGGREREGEAEEDKWKRGRDNDSACAKKRLMVRSRRKAGKEDQG